MSEALRQSVELLVTSLQGAIDDAVRREVRAEVERALTERLSLLAGGPVASQEPRRATIPKETGRQKGYLTYEDASGSDEPLNADEVQERMEAADWNTAIKSVASSRRGSQPELVAVPPKVRRGPGRPPKERAKESPIPIGSLGRIAVGRATYTAEIVGFNPKNGKVVLSYVNTKGQPMQTERDPSLVEVV